MAPDAAITMNAPAYHNLEFTNTTLQACDNSMWQGIKYNAGYLLMDNTTIRDAAFAVQANGTNQNTKFDIVNSQFLNNHNHLTISDDIDLSSTVHATTLDVQGALLPPYDNLNYAEIGVDIKNVTGWTFGDTDPTLANQLHNFSTGVKSYLSGVELINTHFSNANTNLSTGVEAIGPNGAYMTISNCSFTSLYRGARVTTMNIFIEHSEFSHCNTGVHTRFAKLTTITIKENTFDHCYSAGIYNYHDITATTRIHLNVFTNTPRPVFSNYLTYYPLFTDYRAKANCIHGASTGWALINIPSPQLYYNTIEAQSVALSMANCQQAAIFDNDFVGPGNGSFGIYASMSPASTYNQNRIEGYTNGIRLAGDYFSQLTNNVFVDGQVGLMLTNNATPGPQGSAQQPQNNHWLQPHYDEGQGINVPVSAIGGDIADISFFYRPNVAELKPWNNNGYQLSPTNAGLVAPPASYNDCSGFFNDDDQPAAAKPLPPVLASTEDYQTSRYIKELQLLALLEGVPEEQLSQAHQNFKSQKESSNQKEVLRIRQEVKDENLTQAQDRTQELNPNNPIEDFTKEFYSTILNWLKDSLPFENLTAQEQATVRQWAALCPFEYGPEVYSARTIAHQIDSVWQSYANPCEGVIPQSLARTAAPNTSLTAYPNPFTHNLELQSDGDLLEVYDVMGQLHHRQKLGSSPRHSLDLEHLPVGVYFLGVFDRHGQELGKTKIIKANK